MQGTLELQSQSVEESRVMRRMNRREEQGSERESGSGWRASKLRENLAHVFLWLQTSFETREASEVGGYVRITLVQKELCSQKEFCTFFVGGLSWVVR